MNAVSVAFEVIGIFATSIAVAAGFVWFITRGAKPGDWP